MLNTPTLAAILVSALLAVLLYLTIPRSTTVGGGRLRIESPMLTWDFALSEIVEAVPANLNVLRTFRIGAVGWPFPPVGWLYSSDYGKLRALASSRRNLHILRFRNGVRLLVSFAGADSEVLSPAASGSYPAS